MPVVRIETPRRIISPLLLPLPCPVPLPPPPCYAVRSVIEFGALPKINPHETAAMAAAAPPPLPRRFRIDRARTRMRTLTYVL